MGHLPRIWILPLCSFPSMVRCPRCGKDFLDESRVVNHMNQPISSCLLFYEEVIRMNDALAASKTRDTPPSPQPSPSLQDWAPYSGSDSIHDQDQDQDLLSVDPLSEHMDVDQGNDERDQRPNSPRPPFRVNYPRASQTYGKGASFMDLFDQDSHALERRSQLYYPFASKNEWEIASFLLRSNLSMKSIDNFLKLQMVGFFSFVKYVCS